MAATSVADSFWSHLSESGLLPAPAIAQVKRELFSAGTTNDVDAAQALMQRGVLTQFQAERLLEGRSRGFFFDEYKLLDLLGVGGMGWVYQAAHVQSGKVVALKVLLEQFKHDRGMLARFQQEARATLRLNHPNIVRTHKLGVAGGAHYMVMDLVEGPSLLEVLLRKKRLSCGQACDFIRQAALGLQHAHDSGLIHRDVKPQNLLIERSGRVKLLDFGLAMMKEGDGGEEFSMAMIFGHECVGTAAYMAPEQAEDSLAVDARSDVYSLGCTLFAALTGDTPFPERSVTDVQRSHRAKIPRDVRTLAPQVPEGVARVVARMLAKDPSQRIATAAEVADALKEWSKPGPLDFDFSRILEERKRQATEKMAEYLKSRPRRSGAGSSTMRPNAASSIVKGSPIAGHVQEGNHTTRSSVDAGTPSSRAGLASKTGPKNSKDPLKIEASGAVLVPVSGDRFRPLTQDRVTFGRNEDCTVQLIDHSVSGRHCEIHFDGDRWWITDLGSRNGTRVNGVPVKHRPLKPGDEITIGSHLTYRLDCAQGDSKRESWFKLTPLRGVAAAVIIAILALLTWWLTAKG